MASPRQVPVDIVVNYLIKIFHVNAVNWSRGARLMLALRLVPLTERVRLQALADLRARNGVLSGGESDSEPDYDYDSEP